MANKTLKTKAVTEATAAHFTDCKKITGLKQKQNQKKWNKQQVKTAYYFNA